MNTSNINKPDVSAQVDGIHKYNTRQKAQYWRLWYPYATLIQRENEHEKLSSISDRLEKAMENEDPVIVIRSFHLAELQKMWWNSGNILINTASALSLSSLVLSSHRKDRIPQVLAMGGIAFHVVHALVWNTDRSAMYGIQPKRKFSNLEPKCTSPDSIVESLEVVLVRKPETGSYFFRTALALCAVGVCAYFYYDKNFVPVKFK